MCDPCCIPICDNSCDDPCSGSPPPRYCCPPKRCRSRELRGGILYTRCDCVKRNGLQYDCPRACCQGQACCRTKPEPRCCPSKFMGRYENMTMGKPSHPGSIQKRTHCDPCCPPMGYSPCSSDPMECCVGPCGPCEPEICCSPCYPSC
uniref:CSON014550 protein n=1 Tax=Culicoides sonorensis TaxID=179676 RepID=A0A336MAT8_CULSO